MERHQLVKPFRLPDDIHPPPQRFYRSRRNPARDRIKVTIMPPPHPIIDLAFTTIRLRINGLTYPILRLGIKQAGHKHKEYEYDIFIGRPHGQFLSISVLLITGVRQELFCFFSLREESRT